MSRRRKSYPQALRAKSQAKFGKFGKKHDPSNPRNIKFEEVGMVAQAKMQAETMAMQAAKSAKTAYEAWKRRLVPRETPAVLDLSLAQPQSIAEAITRVMEPLPEGKEEVHPTIDTNQKPLTPEERERLAALAAMESIPEEVIVGTQIRRSQEQARQRIEELEDD